MGPVQGDSCPRCGDRSVVTGGVEERVGFFFPDGVRWWRRLFAPGEEGTLLAQTRGRFRACAGCGLVWTELSADALRRLLDQPADAEADAADEPAEASVLDPAPERPHVP